jgi:hypothetical protein
MIVFAILGLLIGLLFMFVRQKLSALESRVNLLTDTVQTMAGFRRVEEDEEEDDEEDEEEEEDEEDEEDEEEEVQNPIFLEVNEPFTKQIVSDDEEEVKHITLDKDEEIKTISLDKDEEIKTISLDNDYESLSLKELKDKVTERGGPKLRTKKELLDFLKNIM